MMEGLNGRNGGNTFNAARRAVHPVRGDKCILKNRYLMLAFALLLPLATVAASTGTVFGQSCGVQVGSMVATTQYSAGNYYGQNNPYSIQLTVPISMSCPTSAQLWAVGTTYDTVTNANLGSNNIIMNANNGYYSGDLVFTVPSSVVEQQLQVQIQVYNSYNNGQYSGLVASSSPTVTINSSSSYQPTGSYSYYNGYPNGYYNGYYYYYYGYPSYYYYSQGYPYYYYSSPYYHYGTSCSNVYYYNGQYYMSCYYQYHHR